MPLSAQQLAAQKNLSYVLAEKLAQLILAGNMLQVASCPARWSWEISLALAVPPFAKR